MSEQSQETTLISVVDNLADSFFSEGASSKNILVPEEKPEHKQPESKLGDVREPFESVNAEDLIGDLLKDSPVDPIKTTKEDKVDDPIKVDDKKVDDDKPSDFNFLVEKGVLNGFEDDAPVKSKKDLETLIKGNREHWETEAKSAAIKEYEESIPDEVKFLVDYAKNGGKDFNSVFKILSQSQEVRSYDLEKAEDQRAVIRNYYASQNWTEDEIEEEIISLSEDKRLGATANRLKPKLDKFNQDRIEEQKQQIEFAKQQEAKAKEYFESNMVNILKKGELGGLKLTKQEQADVYNALIKEKYQGFDGPTNRLGALLDKIQYVEPNYELLAKVTMYLSDPVGFEKKIRDQINTEVAAEHVVKIKIDKGKQKINSQHNPEPENKKVPRLSQGFINPFE